MVSCVEKLRAKSRDNNTLVCLGLDTDPAKLPAHIGPGTRSVLRFNRSIIAAINDVVCAYKPNAAFYEALGTSGIGALIATRESVPLDTPVILDFKRGDIGNTAEKYAVFAYDVVGADAVTINPYMGFDAVKPFLRPDKCVFLLCLTSNPSASDFQFLESGGRPLYEIVAEKAVAWAEDGDVGLVAGATQAPALGRIRDIVGDMPILVPGVGAQGGDLKAVIDNVGGEPGATIINSSRGILYASNGHDFDEAAKKSAEKLRDDINAVREAS